MKRLLLCLAAATLFAGWTGTACAAAQPVNVLAAENFYGDVAEQIGGSDVRVLSILKNPDQDPHMFEVSPSTARAVAVAKLVVYNGVDYDPWMDKLLAASPSKDRTVILAADLMHKKSGDNPHLWYDPATMIAVATAIATQLGQTDPAHEADYQRNLAAFETSLQPLNDRINTLREKYAGTMVTATEPVFGYMAAAIGLKMRNEGFQLAVMNDTEPSASDVAAFEDDLKTGTAKVLFYNNQTSDDLTMRLTGIANDAKIPVVGVSETEPPGTRYQQWMIDQLDSLGQALSIGKM
ncbi:MAG TPA: zinc ABC transporter substrate-binding protein [Dongiaceae bacterium]|jgi:zinc/manganese transport system substrate-binding protein